MQQCSLQPLHSLIQMISLMPPRLNQYEWLDVSVIYTWVVFQEILSISGSRIMLSVDGWRVHLAGNQQTFTVAELFQKHKGNMHFCEHSIKKRMRIAATDAHDEWRGYNLGGGFSLLAPRLTFHLKTPFSSSPTCSSSLQWLKKGPFCWYHFRLLYISISSA